MTVTDYLHLKCYKSLFFNILKIKIVRKARKLYDLD
jgi:hypothetical protein